jgi:CPA2 family monovalent cation:H+ antiporter-2
VLILAAEERVLSADSAQRGLAVIALSLLAAPLLIRWSGRLSGRLAAAPLEDREGVDYSAGMDEPDGRHVLLVGEAGTLVRLGERLESHGYPWRGISGNAAEVHRLAGADGRLLFGDPGRRELLHAAGIRRAEALVVLAGEAGHPARVVRQARLLAPGLSIVGFAKSAAQGQTLLDAGANDVALEIDALDAVHELRLLRFLGLPAEAVAGRVAEVCRSLNEATPVSAVSTARHAESKVTPR